MQLQVIKHSVFFLSTKKQIPPGVDCCFNFF